MSTFDGIVKEIPYIRVDRFDTYNENTQLFLITHCHMDHMKGLEEGFFEKLRKKNLFLYGTPISIRILKSIYPKYENQLKELYVGESAQLAANYNDSTVYLTVSVIPAGHCPGSAMFLFENDEERILCTGDFRIDNIKQFVSKYFHPVRTINAIYLDTTFCKKEFPFFPSRKDTLEGLCRVIESWLTLDEANVIHFNLPTKYGSEFLFMQVVKKTRQKIHVSPERYHLHKFIPDLDEIVTINNQNLRIHACNNVNCGVAKSDAARVCTIKITAKIWEDYQIGDSVIKREGDNFYRVCASYHPSYNEICEFIEYLRPDRIVPCVLPEDKEEGGVMVQLLKEMVNRYSKKIKECEKYFIDTEKFIKNERELKQTSTKDKLLASPPRKFIKKNLC